MAACNHYRMSKALAQAAGAFYMSEITWKETPEGRNSEVSRPRWNGGRGAFQGDVPVSILHRSSYDYIKSQGAPS